MWEDDIESVEWEFGHTGASASPSVQSPLPAVFMKFWFVYDTETAKRIIAHSAKRVHEIRRTALTRHLESRSSRRRRVSNGMMDLAIVIGGFPVKAVQ